ncbi:MAG: hypothetical protein JSU81_00720 [Candidatus Coatesbacteria bacterium]|nr:MAG: hypothetical protein JSU81_00720 [Candidatus Coatesbacteria bacterium]
MRSEHAHVYLGQNASAANGGEEAARAARASFRREWRRWYRRVLARRRAREGRTGGEHPRRP